MLENFLENILLNYLHGDALIKLISVLISLSIIILCAVFSYYVVKFIAEKYLKRIVSIAINSVRIRNSDNTVATIPTYMLTTEVVKNWRTIEDYGERRIKRVLLLDVNSIKAYKTEELTKYMAIESLTNYIVKNQQANLISNVELFRAYIEGYLKNNPHISHDSTIMVHQLELGPNGLPLEIYAYTTKVIWEDYQRLSSNIIEHCLVTLPLFDLKAFQLNS